MSKAEIIKSVAELLLNNRKEEAIKISNDNYPFDFKENAGRKYTKTDSCKVFLKDGFIDRYTGEQLLFPGFIKILSLELPDIFKYHSNWKMSETHIIYWEMFPTVDHIIPVARGGDDEEHNWVTTSMIINSAKSNWTIEELNWTIHERGNLNNWDGLSSIFLQLVDENPEYVNKDKSILQWKNALIKAKKELKL